VWTRFEASEWRVVVVSLAIPALLATPVRAQDAVQQARERFGEGVDCVESEDWACAEERFREALALHDAATIRYNLASVLVELGEYPEAARLAASVLDDDEADDALRERAQALLDLVAERGGVAEVAIDGAPPDAELRVDGEVVPPEQHGAIPLAEGEHVFSIHAGGETLSERTETVEAGATVPVPIAVVATPEETAEQSDEESGGGVDFDALVEDPIFWAVAGGAVAGVVLIVVIIAVAASSGSQDPVMGDFEPGVLRW